MDERRGHALTDRDAAQLLGLSVATLRAWRLQQRGPRFVRLGRAVRYLPADLERFIEANAVERPTDLSLTRASRLPPP
jgi:predicted DNA-binding transcriptional regulator AlpA